MKKDHVIEYGQACYTAHYHKNQFIKSEKIYEEEMIDEEPEQEKVFYHVMIHLQNLVFGYY